MNGIKIIVSFFGGLIVGSLGTYFVMNKKVDQRVEEQTEELKEYYHAKIESVRSKEAKEAEKPDILEKKESVESNDEQPKKKTELLENSEIQTQKVPYFKMVKDLYNKDNIKVLDEDNIKVETAEEKLERIIEANPYRPAPYPISYEAYSGDDEVHYRDDYDHITVDYFAGDSIVAYMDSHEIVNNEEKLLGIHWKRAFGDYDNYGYTDEDSVYIRNDNMHLDIEVIRDKGSYAEMMYGDIEKGEDS